MGRSILRLRSGYTLYLRKTDARERRSEVDSKRVETFASDTRPEGDCQATTNGPTASGGASIEKRGSLCGHFGATDGEKRRRRKGGKKR